MAPPRNQIYFQAYEAIRSYCKPGSTPMKEGSLNHTTEFEDSDGMDSRAALVYEKGDFVYIPIDVDAKESEPRVGLRRDPKHPGAINVGFVMMDTLHKLENNDVPVPFPVHGFYEPFMATSYISFDSMLDDKAVFAQDSLFCSFAQERNFFSPGDALYIDHFSITNWSLFDKLDKPTKGSSSSKKRKYDEMKARQPRNKLPVFNLRRGWAASVDMANVRWLANATALETVELNAGQKRPPSIPRDTNSLATPAKDDLLTTAGQYRTGILPNEFVVNVKTLQAGWYSKKSFRPLTDNELAHIFPVQITQPETNNNLYSETATEVDINSLRETTEVNVDSSQNGTDDLSTIADDDDDYREITDDDLNFNFCSDISSQLWNKASTTCDDNNNEQFDVSDDGGSDILNNSELEKFELEQNLEYHNHILSKLVSQDRAIQQHVYDMVYPPNGLHC